MADKKRRDHQISIPGDEAQVIRSMARVAGEKHGIQGNFRGFVRSIASGQRGVVEVNESPQVWELFQTINVYLFGCNAFKLQYQDDSCKVIDVEIVHAIIELNPVRGWYLIAASPTENPTEIPLLRHNHTIFLRQIITMGGLSNAAWIPKMESVLASFWVSNVFEYREMDGDSQQSVGIYRDILPERCRRRGIIINRTVYSSYSFQMALRNYSDSHILLPVELRNTIKIGSEGQM
jgi:hypothetical protein